MFRSLVPAVCLALTVAACSSSDSDLRPELLGSQVSPPLLVGIPEFDEVPEIPEPVIKHFFHHTMEWSTPDRFGLDLDGDGFLDLPNTPEYVTPPDGRFEVAFDATGSTAWASVDGEPTDVEVLRYLWRFDSDALVSPLRVETSEPEVVVRLPEGPAQVEFTIVVEGPDGWASGSVVESFEVEDILIVVMGDSYASGDGNPDVPRTEATEAVWADPNGPSGDSHAAASRSSAAWPLAAAAAIEAADSHTSVTLVSVAASGARIDRGMLGPQRNVSLISQVEHAVYLVAERQVDAVVMSIGGNDIGFGRIVAGLVDADPEFDPLCYDTDIEALLQSIHDGDWTRSTSLTFRPGWTNPIRLTCTIGDDANGPQLVGLDGLPDELDRLADELAAALSPGRVYVLEYPEPSSGPDGQMCREVVGDAISFVTTHEIDETEQQLALERVVDPLNAAIGEAALQHGWILLRGVRDAFADGHGYCGSWPSYAALDDSIDRLDQPTAWYRAGGGQLEQLAGVTWFRTAAQSSVLQGPNDRTRTTGTLHPNELGHAAIADILVSQWRG